MKNILITIIFILVFTLSCSTENIRISGNWIETTDKTYINRILENNNKLKSFKAKFYLTESKKRMAMNGRLIFNRKNKNFSLMLKDVLVGSKILSMKKKSNLLLINFHRKNRKIIEHVNQLDLSRYNFLFELEDLIKFISLEIPLMRNAKIYEEKNKKYRIYLFKKNSQEHTIILNKKTGRVERINYTRAGNRYSIKYLSYIQTNDFYYPETVKILNYTQRQRISIKIESIKFTDSISDNVFNF